MISYSVSKYPNKIFDAIVYEILADVLADRYPVTLVYIGTIYVIFQF